MVIWENSCCKVIFLRVDELLSCRVDELTYFMYFLLCEKWFSFVGANITIFA